MNQKSFLSRVEKYSLSSRKKHLEILSSQRKQNILKADFVHRPGHVKLKCGTSNVEAGGGVAVPLNDCVCVCV